MDFKRKIKALQIARFALLQAIDSFPTDKREEILFDDWNLVQVMGHISGWNLLRISELNDLINGNPITKTDDYDAYNVQFMQERKGQTWDEAYQELVESCEELIATYQGLPDELVGQKIWNDSDKTVTDWIDIDIDHWNREHLDEMRKYVKTKMPRWMAVGFAKTLPALYKITRVFGVLMGIGLLLYVGLSVYLESVSDALSVDILGALPFISLAILLLLPYKKLGQRLLYVTCCSLFFVGLILLNWQLGGVFYLILLANFGMSTYLLLLEWIRDPHADIKKNTRNLILLILISGFAYAFLPLLIF